MGPYMRIRLIFVIALFLIWCVATIAMVHPTTGSLETIKFIVISLAGFGVISSTFLNIWNAWEASQNLNDKISFDKTENSFNYIERWDNESLRAARDLSRNVKKQKRDLSDTSLLTEIRESESTERSVITLFNFWEEIHKSILHDRVNEKVLKDGFGQIYCDMYDRFKVWRDDMKKKGDNVKGMTALDELYEMWRKVD